MVDESIIDEIEELYHSFDKAYDVYEKGYILSVLDYLKKLMPDNEKIKGMHFSIGTKLGYIHRDLLSAAQFRTLCEKNYININKKVFDKKMPIYGLIINYPYYDLMELEQENLLYILESFLSGLSKDLYCFYQKLVQEKRIVYSYDNCTLATSLYNSNSIVCIEKLKTLLDVYILSHEIGHAYYMHLNNQRIIDRKNIDNDIKDEIVPKIMEIEFIKFLTHNKVIEPSLTLRNEFDLTMQDCYRKRRNYDRLKYYVASYIAKRKKDIIDIDNYFKYIYETDLIEIVDNVNSKNKVKVLTK